MTTSCKAPSDEACTGQMRQVHRDRCHVLGKIRFGCEMLLDVFERRQKGSLRLSVKDLEPMTNLMTRSSQALAAVDTGKTRSDDNAWQLACIT